MTGEIYFRGLSVFLITGIKIILIKSLWVLEGAGKMIFFNFNPLTFYRKICIKTPYTERSIAQKSKKTDAFEASSWDQNCRNNIFLTDPNWILLEFSNFLIGLVGQLKIQFLTYDCNFFKLKMWEIEKKNFPQNILIQRNL